MAGVEISMSNIIRNKTIWGKQVVVEGSEINDVSQFVFTGNLLLPGTLQKSIRQVKIESEWPMNGLTNL